MNIKVEIKGMDTSKLPKISSSQQMILINRYKNGELDLKDEIINCNLRLVLSLVKKFNNRGENVDDIFQVGVIGLIKAIENFDINQGVQLSTYAVPMIIGEIKRFLRDNSAFRVSRSIRDLAYKISQIREQYIKEKSEEPTIEVLCKMCDTDREEIIIALDSLNTPMSLNDVIYNDGGDCIFVIDKLRDSNDESEMITDKIATAQILDKLNEKERYIIEKRYFKDKTQIELAEELGVSQAHISRIEKSAIERIRRKIIK